MGKEANVTQHYRGFERIVNMMIGTSRRFLLSLGVFGALLASVPVANSQTIESPDRKAVFREDSKIGKKEEKKQQLLILKDETSESKDIDLNAPHVEFQQERNVVRGTGGAIVSGNGIKAQSDTATVNTQTTDAELQGEVLFSGGMGEISADSAKVNLEKETGVFDNANFTLDQGSYDINSEKLNKLSEFDYKLDSSSFSTCHCEDGAKPWSIECGSATITEEGYAHTYNTTLNFYGVPVLYSPYFLFPVKKERASGLLVPSFGYSSKDGLQLKVPLFMVIDESTDMTLRPFYEAKTRQGLGLDFRKTYSRQNAIRSRLMYSDESARDGDLRGIVYSDPDSPGSLITNLDQLSSPPFDENRMGGFYSQSWTTEPGADVPVSFLADIHYVSDDLFLRELPDEDIGDPQSRYTSSNIVLRVNPLESVTAQVSGEYTQYLDSTDDHRAFQRYPEFALSGLKSFRPFGFNPLGAKLVTLGKATATNFVREDGYEGWRYDVNPNVSVPFHFGNYLSQSVTVGARKTFYKLGETLNPNDNTELDSSTDRTIYNFGYTASTAVEKVFDVQDGDFLRTLTSLGSLNKADKLVRIKHVIEPTFKYNLVPDVAQDENPFFDSLDRLRDKSLFSFAINNSIYGKFMPRGGAEEAIDELAPAVEDLPTLSADMIPGDVTGTTDSAGFGNVISTRRGTVREIVRFGVVESYDYFEDKNDKSPNQDAWSDLGAYVGLYPSQNFALKVETDIDIPESDFSSWAVGANFRDDRGDIVRARYNFLEDSISQIEGNIEIGIVDRVRAGYYARYDDRSSEFIEQRVGLRFAGGCDCWHFDIGYSDRVNPDKQLFLLSFTFGGLGDISQDVLFRQNDSVNSGQ